MAPIKTYPELLEVLADERFDFDPALFSTPIRWHVAGGGSVLHVPMDLVCSSYRSAYPPVLVFHPVSDVPGRVCDDCFESRMYAKWDFVPVLNAAAVVRNRIERAENKLDGLASFPAHPLSDVQFITDAFLDVDEAARWWSADVDGAADRLFAEMFARVAAVRADLDEVGTRSMLRLSVASTRNGKLPVSAPVSFAEVFGPDPVATSSAQNNATMAVRTGRDVTAMVLAGVARRCCSAPAVDAAAASVDAVAELVALIVKARGEGLAADALRFAAEADAAIDAEASVAAEDLVVVYRRAGRTANEISRGYHSMLWGWFDSSSPAQPTVTVLPRVVAEHLRSDTAIGTIWHPKVLGAVAPGDSEEIYAVACSMVTAESNPAEALDYARLVFETV